MPRGKGMKYCGNVHYYSICHILESGSRQNRRTAGGLNVRLIPLYKKFTLLLPNLGYNTGVTTRKRFFKEKER